MKHIFCYRKACLLLFLVLLSLFARAQGTEKVLEAFQSLIFALLALAGMAVLFLIVFFVKRTIVAAVTSGIFGAVLLVFGLWLAFILDRGNTVGLASAGNLLQMGGVLNLVLVFVFMLVFTKKQRLNPTQGTAANTQTLPDQKTEGTVKWITALFILWFFFNLISAVQFLGNLLMMNGFGIRIQDIFIIALTFLMVVVLLVSLILFMHKKRAGWNLLLFSSIYSILGTLVFIARNVLLQYSGKLYLSEVFFVSQGIILLFLAVCVRLLIKSDVLNRFGVSKKSRNLTFIYSIAIVVAWTFLSQQIIFFLSGI